MTEPGLYAAFVAATAALMLVPGPNVALITANSVAHGTRYGLLTVAATGAAVAVQLALVTSGLAAALAAAGAAFRWLRWTGAAYLLWLGVRELLAPAADLARIPAAPGGGLARTIVARGLLTALANPKTLLFLAAFFPQFISPDSPAGSQAAILAATFVALNVAIDSLWAVAAGRARPLLMRRARLRRGLAGGVLIAAALGLGAADRD